MTFLNGSDRTGLADGDKRELRCGTLKNAFPHGRQPKYDIEATYISPFQVRCDLPMGLTCGGSSAAQAFRLLEERSLPHACAHYRLCVRAHNTQTQAHSLCTEVSRARRLTHIDDPTARLAAREKLAIAHPRENKHTHTGKVARAASHMQVCTHDAHRSHGVPGWSQLPIGLQRRVRFRNSQRCRFSSAFVTEKARLRRFRKSRCHG